MPPVTVGFYRDSDGSVPVLEWLKKLQKDERRAFAGCVARIRLLAEMGYELRRPHVDTLRDGIHELRSRTGRVNYRILYFFSGRDVVVLAHGMTKEGKIPDADLARALDRKRRYELDPDAHTYREDVDNG